MCFEVLYGMRCVLLYMAESAEGIYYVLEPLGIVPLVIELPEGSVVCCSAC